MLGETTMKWMRMEQATEPILNARPLKKEQGVKKRQREGDKECSEQGERIVHHEKDRFLMGEGTAVAVAKTKLAVHIHTHK